jgi:hypothetical protein
MFIEPAEKQWMLHYSKGWREQMTDAVSIFCRFGETGTGERPD